MNRMLKISVLLTVVMLCGCSESWQSRLKDEIPAMGHRNWIVVADSAYPKQSNPGIETIYTGKGQVEVLQYVLDEIEKAPHISPIVLIDAELDAVRQSDAPGVDQYRSELMEVLAGREVKKMPHEDIIRKLDEGAELFNILLLKTDMTIPYTSVFLELDCGYWDSQKEAKLRAVIGK